MFYAELRTGRYRAAAALPVQGIHFAHTDLSAYSVFEEGLYHGTRAGRAAAGRSSA